MLDTLTHRLSGILMGNGRNGGPSGTRRGRIDFNDMLSTIRMMKRMGPIKSLMKMLPGIGTLVPDMVFGPFSDTRRAEAIILSMTRNERSNPDIIGGSRCQRIARGSGTSLEDVHALLRFALSA